MKIRVTLMREKNIDVNDIVKLYGISKEEYLRREKTKWDIASVLSSKDTEKIACESVELVEE